MSDKQMEQINGLVDRIGERSGELRAQIEKLVKERNALRAALIEAELALEGHEDVMDGPEGQQLPNPAMRALGSIRRALYLESNP